MSEKLSRREFIRTTGKIGCFTGMGLLMNQRIFPREDLKKRSSDFDLVLVQGSPEQAVRKGLQHWGGLKKFIRPNDTILLKPNVSFPNPKEWGSTTSPEVVSTVAKLALEAGAARVIVADNTMREGDLCFRKTGLSEALKDIPKVKVLPLQKESFFHDSKVVDGKALHTVQSAKLIERCDVLINLPCAKSHSATKVSFGLKNLMGLIWDRNYFHSNTDLHRAIAELATVIRPHLTILDASRALVTGGPTGPGKVRDLSSILIGTDPLAVDAYAVTMANWNNRMEKVEFVKHLAFASKLGVGNIDVKTLSVRAEQV